MYPVNAPPPSLDGGDHDTATEPDEAVAVTDKGVPGGLYPVVTVELGVAATEYPAPLCAKTRMAYVVVVARPDNVHVRVTRSG